MPKGIYLHRLPPPSRKGSHLTEAQKQHLREVNKDKTPWNKGKKDSDETKLLKSKNNARYWLGKKRPPFTPEALENMRIVQLGRVPNQKQREAVGKVNRGKFGKEHPVWKEEKKRPLYKAIRQLFKYKDWRNRIFTRDNFTCVLCGATKVYVEADHYPARFVDILKKNSIENVDQALDCAELWEAEGRTLCKPCHLKTLTWGRTRLQRIAKQ